MIFRVLLSQSSGIRQHRAVKPVPNHLAGQHHGLLTDLQAGNR